MTYLGTETSFQLSVSFSTNPFSVLQKKPSGCVALVKERKHPETVVQSTPIQSLFPVDGITFNITDIRLSKGFIYADQTLWLDVLEMFT